MCAQQTTCRLNGERGERGAEGKTGFRGLSPFSEPQGHSGPDQLVGGISVTSGPDGHGADGVKGRA